MKITNIRTYAVRIPYQHGGPFPSFGGKARTTMDILLLRVETDAGITGWGEAFGGPVLPATRAVLDQNIAALAIGRDATQISLLMEDLTRKLQNFGRGGPVMFALSGLDIALWDIAGKAAGLPVHRLLGGAVRKEVFAYASMLAYHDPDVVARNAADAVAKGYRYVKAHEYEEAEIAAARQAVGAGVPLMVDTNCPWTAEEAIAMARRLERYDLHWLEEPIWPPENFQGLAAIRRAAPMPIAAGENARTLFDFKRMIDSGAVSVLQPSLGKMGGITEARKILPLAEAGTVRVTPHCTYFGPAALATLHLISTFRSEPIFERFYCELEASPFGTAVTATNGRVSIPDGPGLGVEPDMTVVEKYSA